MTTVVALALVITWDEQPAAAPAVVAEPTPARERVPSRVVPAKRRSRTAQPVASARRSEQHVDAPAVLSAPPVENAREVASSPAVASAVGGAPLLEGAREVVSAPQVESAREVVSAPPVASAEVADVDDSVAEVVSPSRLAESDGDAPPAPPAEPATGNGEAIARAIADAKRAAVRECFERELKQQPKLAGTVVVELDLAAPDRVESLRVSDDLARPEFTRCVTAAMQTVRFAALDEDVSVRVPYALSAVAR